VTRSKRGEGRSVAALPEELIGLLRRASPCFVATLMPDGSPQLTQTWVHTDGEHLIINIIEGHQKAKNLARDPRVAVNVVVPEDLTSYYAVRGRVVSMTPEGAWDSINELSQKYLGMAYPDFTGKSETRLVVTIEAHSIRSSRPGGVKDR
jgi:PPOX class probable F420-dependent enzyme